MVYGLVGARAGLGAGTRGRDRRYRRLRARRSRASAQPRLRRGTLPHHPRRLPRAAAARAATVRRPAGGAARGDRCWPSLVWRAAPRRDAAAARAHATRWWPRRWWRPGGALDGGSAVDARRPAAAVPCRHVRRRRRGRTERDPRSWSTRCAPIISSSYGYTAANDTPRSTPWRPTASRYAHTFSQASWTRPSVATILTGLYPSSHGAVHKADILPDRVDTLAEVLSRGGYNTVGFANNVNVSPSFNFGQGFDEYRYLAPDLFFHANEPAAQLTLYNGLRLVRERFLARRVDVHNYYQPAEVVTDDGHRVARLAGREGGAVLPVRCTTWTRTTRTSCIPFNGEGYARVANPEPAAGRGRQVSRSLRRRDRVPRRRISASCSTELKRRGLYDRTLIVAHRRSRRGVPGARRLVARHDAVRRADPRAAHREAAASAARRAASSTSWRRASTSRRPSSPAGSDPVPPVMQGHALPLDGGERASTRDSVFAEEDLEGNVLQSVRTPVWKLITANPGNPRGLQPEELYDLKSDPGEQHEPGRAATPALLEELRAALGRSLSRGAGARGSWRADRRRQRHEGPAARARLRELTHAAVRRAAPGDRPRRGDARPGRAVGSGRAAAGPRAADGARRVGTAALDAAARRRSPRGRPLVTGVNPGRHGVLDFVERVPGTLARALRQRQPAPHAGAVDAAVGARDAASRC